LVALRSHGRHRSSSARRLHEVAVLRVAVAQVEAQLHLVGNGGRQPGEPRDRLLPGIPVENWREEALPHPDLVLRAQRAEP
jgi:hypothetical protein